MEPLIVRRAVLAEHAPWRDTPTDTDPLPPMVMIGPDGNTGTKPTRLTEVRQETTDDQ